MMIASIAPRIALNRVKMFARTIWATVRVGAAGTSFVRPSRDALGDLGGGEAAGRVDLG